MSLVPLVAAWKNQLVEMSRNKEVYIFRVSFNNPVNIRCLQDTLWIHFDAARLSVPVALLTSTFSEISHLLMHRQLPNVAFGQLFKSSCR